jgi:hypothetical protein
MPNVKIADAECKVALHHDRHGYVKALGDQWTDYHTGTRYGAFMTNYMPQQVNLPLSEVKIDYFQK